MLRTIAGPGVRTTFTALDELREASVYRAVGAAVVEYKREAFAMFVQLSAASRPTRVG